MAKVLLSARKYVNDNFGLPKIAFNYGIQINAINGTVNILYFFLCKIDIEHLKEKKLTITDNPFDLTVILKI